MVEETPNFPEPTQKPVEETPNFPEPTQKPVPEKTKAKIKKPGKWFGRIPKEILFSPGGVILIVLAVILEIIDWIPIPVFDQLWEMGLEIIFIIFFLIITKLPWQNAVISFIIERIPLINDYLPTWLIRMFI